MANGNGTSGDFVDLLKAWYGRDKRKKLDTVLEDLSKQFGIPTERLAKLLKPQIEGKTPSEPT